MCRWSSTNLRIGRIQQKEVVKDFVGGSISHHQYNYLKHLWKEGGEERRGGERRRRERKMEGDKWRGHTSTPATLPKSTTNL